MGLTLRTQPHARPRVTDLEVERLSDPDDRKEGEKVCALLRRRRVARLIVIGSALSLRVFGEDITTAAREAAEKRREALSAQDGASAPAATAPSERVAAHAAGEGQEDEVMRSGE